MARKDKTLHAGTGKLEETPGGRAAGWINLASGMEGCERIEAYFSGPAYQPHRHDTYAIGCTLSGVQQFRYRGGVSEGLPGTAMVIHPDELHDGQGGTEDGFHYRMFYLDPALVQTALGAHQPLPFVAGGISRDPRLLRTIGGLVSHIGAPMETLQYNDAVYDLALALQAAGEPSAARVISAPDSRAAHVARDFLRQACGRSVSLEHLEQATGQDRWQLSRDFRALFGTSPYRYLTLRRLDHARALIRAGASLVQAALEAGFADQAHFTRHFRSAFGMTPARWRRLICQPERADAQLARTFKKPPTGPV
ncbi:AraC family transcriptional regulator [Pannonibacter sp. I15F10I1]|uniref:helix-turn-helix domain-containing protein n=1 Tax=Pannonibacter sp. I15F10I1 TaxID=2003580 RepID=UPI001AD8DD45|nr:AraC family transcriptional regulator [Pannonibacter sp. I15F10I1]